MLLRCKRCQQRSQHASSGKRKAPMCMQGGIGSHPNLTLLGLHPMRGTQMNRRHSIVVSGRSILRAGSESSGCIGGAKLYNYLHPGHNQVSSAPAGILRNCWPQTWRRGGWSGPAAWCQWGCSCRQCTRKAPSFATLPRGALPRRPLSSPACRSAGAPCTCSMQQANVEAPTHSNKTACLEFQYMCRLATIRERREAPL